MPAGIPCRRLENVRDHFRELLEPSRASTYIKMFIFLKTACLRPLVDFGSVRFFFAPNDQNLLSIRTKWQYQFNVVELLGRNPFWEDRRGQRWGIEEITGVRPHSLILGRSGGKTQMRKIICRQNVDFM